MAVSISGLVSGLNWQQIVTELVSADSAGINQVKARQATVTSKENAITGMKTDLTGLETDVFNLENGAIYGQVTGTSTTVNSGWQVNPLAGTPAGNYSLAVSRLATATRMTGATGISAGISAGNDVSGVTLATMNTATPATAGTFTVNGQRISVTTSESLADVFAAISTATGTHVTAGYDHTTDRVTLTSDTGTLQLGAANDTSNLLQALRLGNSGGASSSSAQALGALSTTAALTSAHLGTPLSGLDGSGNGSFTINGVAITYNGSTDTLSTVMGKINNSAAGVTAVYDAQQNQMVLTNNATGDTAINVADGTGNLMSALGLAAGTTTTYGRNAQFSVNGGPIKTSASNALTPADLGVPGLNVTVNSESTQTVQVSTDTTGMASAIETFIADFNKVQGDITSNTSINTTNGSVVTSLLSSEHEVGDWGRTLQRTAFSAGNGSGGAFGSLDSLGIDFDGITGNLKIADSAKLTQALTTNPTAVKTFFATAHTGFGSVLNNALNDIIGQTVSETNILQSQFKDFGTQIDTMQRQLDSEQAKLTAAFTQMEAAQAQMQSESSTLSGLTFQTSSGSTSAGGKSTLNSGGGFVSSSK